MPCRPRAPTWRSASAFEVGRFVPGPPHPVFSLEPALATAYSSFPGRAVRTGRSGPWTAAPSRSWRSSREIRSPEGLPVVRKHCKHLQASGASVESVKSAVIPAPVKNPTSRSSRSSRLFSSSFFDPCVAVDCARFHQIALRKNIRSFCRLLQKSHFPFAFLAVFALRSVSSGTSLWFANICNHLQGSGASRMITSVSRVGRRSPSGRSLAHRLRCSSWSDRLRN
jgi:hypothetical protein